MDVLEKTQTLPPSTQADYKMSRVDLVSLLSLNFQLNSIELTNLISNEATHIPQ